MKILIFTLFSACIYSTAQAERLVELSKSEVQFSSQLAGIVSACPERFEGREIIEGIRGTFPQGISMTFTMSDNTVVSARWDKATRTASCD